MRSDPIPPPPDGGTEMADRRDESVAHRGTDAEHIIVVHSARAVLRKSFEFVSGDLLHLLHLRVTTGLRSGLDAKPR